MSMRDNYLVQVAGMLVISAVFMMSAGCQPEIIPPSKSMVAETIDVTEGADLQRTTEVQLVEQMARYREQYRRHLDVLRDFYDRQGNHLKASWAQQELENLEMGPQHAYLVVAEIAGPELKANTAIVDADLLYKDGLEYYRQGRGKIGKLFADNKKLYLAKERFNELITKYPSSDKIDDAAFQIGEIYQHYLKDYHKALIYYQRVWQWDPQTPLPARYSVARIYDDYLHDRVKAMEYYQMAVNLESAYPAKVDYAKTRIREINMELSKE
ncbi:MAG: tetratricopeptide repeat protein [Sedimentisphaerales bacterium]|nr:tetratricopeptide repeat protein [Sedimentisphaerales bacterium]